MEKIIKNFVPTAYAGETVADFIEFAFQINVDSQKYSKYKRNLINMFL